MSRLVAAIAAAVLLVQAPASFEGRLRVRIIELQVDEDGSANKLLDVAPAMLAAREDAKVESSTVLIKGSVLRTMGGADGDGGFALWDLAKHTMILVQPGERAYFEVPTDDGAARAGTRPRPAGAAPKSLGARTINGLKTTGYEVHGADDVVIRGWMSQDDPGLTWAFRDAMSQPGSEADEEDPVDAATAQLTRYGFPVLMYTLYRGSLRVEEVTVERTTLSPDQFKVPVGYTKRSLERPQ
jgi:hypothetical protein